MPGLPIDAASVGPAATANQPDEETIAKTAKNPTQHSALASLAASYGDFSGSGSESEDEGELCEEHPPTSADDGPNKINSLGEVLDAEKILHVSATATQEMLLEHAGNIDEVTISMVKDTDKNGMANGTGESSSKTDTGELARSSCPGQAFAEMRSDGNHASGSETSDSDSDSSNEDDDSSGSNTMSDSDEELVNIAKLKHAPRVKGEKRLCDLPPIEDLHITVPHEKCSPIGVVKSFVDPLVIVAGDPGTPALDLDSVLFLEQGDRALGKIFDVFGPVKEPHYCVRFNSKEHIESSKIECGMRVYCAPDTPHSSFILLAQLSRFRGTDASWKDDIEPPAEVQEFSDDEMEEFARRGGRRHVRARGRGAAFAGSFAPDANSESSRGRKRQFLPDQPSTALCLPQNPFIPSNVPGFRPRIPFHRGRGGGRGFPRPPRHAFDFRHQQPRQHFHPSQQQQPLTNNYSMDSFNEYWSTYWTNYYYQNPNPVSSQVPQYFQNPSFTPAQFYQLQPPPPPPDK